MLKEFITKKKEFFLQFLKFGIVGLSNTLLSYILYIVILKILEHFNLFPEYDYIISSFSVFWICSLWSFWWNNKFTFNNSNRENSNLLFVYLKMVICYALTGLFLQNILLFLLVKYAGFSKEIVPLLILVVTVPLNFLLNRYWAFSSADCSDSV